MMKKTNILILSLFIGLSLSAPVDESEVELIEPMSSHEQDSETSFFNAGRSPIFVVHGSFPQNFPLFRGQNVFPSHGFPFSAENIFGVPRKSQNDDEDQKGVEIDFLPSSFDYESENEDKDDSRPICGLFCKIFADLNKQLSWINRQQQGNTEGLFPSLAPSDKANSTYTEKVLPDGSVVRINQTTFSDSDDNGNAFFFHQSTHVLDGSSDENEKVEGEILEEESKSPEGPTNKVENKPKVEIIPDEDIGFKLPENFDPNLNEVSEVGVDGGLLTQ